MKVLQKIFISVLVLSSLSSCEMMMTLIEPSSIKLKNVPNDRLSFDENEDSFVVKFSTNSSWRVTSDAEWCRMTPSSGNSTVTELTLTVDKNMVPEERKAVVILSTDDSESRAIFNVIQDQMTLLSVDDADFELPDDGGTIKVELKHNAKYYVSMPSGVKWISKKASKAIATTVHEFVVEPNPTEVSRSAVISFRENTEKAVETIKVFQHGLPPKRNLIMKVKHVNDKFYVPEFNEGLTGMIYWGIADQGDPYGSGIGYNYGQSGGEKVVTFDLTGYHNKFTTEFENIKGIVEIDLSGL